MWPRNAVFVAGRYIELPRHCYCRLLKYVGAETVLAPGADASKLPEKSVLDMEKSVFSKYQDIMLRYLHGSTRQQMVALYTLQTFCHEHNFPKGQLTASDFIQL